jgi:FkbM family methyltransferase
MTGLVNKALHRRVLGVVNEVRGAAAITVGIKSFVRLSYDLLVTRIVMALALPADAAIRTIRTRFGIVSYRANMGDLQSIREVLAEQHYRLPQADYTKDVLLDLGANIGLTSLYLSKKYGFAHVIGVEPSEENARLAARNFVDNGLNGSVVCAAIGPDSGSGLFSASGFSNLGRIADQGVSVEVISVDDVLRKAAPKLFRTKAGGEEPSVVVKMDIEGGEQALLEKAIGWLSRVRLLIAEFHPPLIDYSWCITRLVNAGFRHCSPGTLHERSMDIFIRK